MNPLIAPPAAQSALWPRLLALDLDGAAALSFSHRLARDNAWPPGFARRVVLEYKRFVYLAATCGHPVTPSDEVDQAWHLHLVYTRSYWDELCGQVLGFPLHHGPTKGGAAEGQKFQDWYGRTLASYQAAFGEAPPPDIWPPAGVRFGEAPYYRRVNVRRLWLVPRPRLLLPLLPWLRRAFNGRFSRRLAGLVVALLVLAGCTARTPLNPFNWYGTEFLALFWGLSLTVFPLALWLQHRGRGPAAPYLGPPLGTYELARLAGRGKLLADAALAALHYGGHLKLLPEQRVQRVWASPPTEPYELAVWHLVPASDTASVADVREQALSSDLPALHSLDEALEQRGLLLPAARRQRLNRLPTLAAGALLLFGLGKVAVGLTRDRPVGLLLASLGLLLVAYVLSRRHLGAWATGSGTEVLAEAEQAARHFRATEGMSGSLVAQWVAFFGVAQLHGIGLGALTDYLVPPPPVSSSDGGGDSGGGDGGGSGCGGCGGCGGD